MSTRNLNRLFAPRSVALAGASANPNSLGHAVWRNLLPQQPGFDIYPVNPRHAEIGGHKCYADLASLPCVPDLVVIATPRSAVMAVAGEAAELGVGAAVVITADTSHGEDSLRARLRALARRSSMRIAGPNCLGVIAPHAGLNASFASTPVTPGGMAVISQSGALMIALLAFAARRSIGFSGAVSLGDMADVDFAAMLDHFALDPHTRAILLYAESIPDAKAFMQAARAAARIKPVIAIKAGRSAQAAQAAATHTGALAGADDVYDAAFRRSGILRVNTISELFNAASALARIPPFNGERLAIVTNGGGLGVLAVDELLEAGGVLAQFSPHTLEHLHAVLPEGWSRANPADIVGDADPQRFRAALAPILADPQVDAVSVMHCPTAMSESHAVAHAIADCVREHRKTHGVKPVFASWLEEDAEIEALFAREGVPLFRTGAIEAFMNMVRWRRRRDALMSTPPASPAPFAPRRDEAHAIIQSALARGETWLKPWDVAALLECYAIPMIATRFAATPQAAASIAQELGESHEAFALKIQSPDIVHKSEVGGVALGLSSSRQVEQAAIDMLARVKTVLPDASVEGFVLQPMARFPHGRELIAGLTDDAVFGPVVVFGQGGKSVEIVRDRAIEFPPLDLLLARRLIARTRVSELLKAWRDEPAVDMEALAQALVNLGQMAAGLPQIVSLDLNPLIAHEHGLIALDARIAIAQPALNAPAPRANPRLAIAPYPHWQEQQIELRGGEQVLIRPVRPQDEDLYRRFLQRVSPSDVQLRFFAAVRNFDHAFIARLTQIDYARACALAAIDLDSGEMTGSVRLLYHPDGASGEYAILVATDWQGRGLGWALMEAMIAEARAAGLKKIEGKVLAVNRDMLRMCRELGFTSQKDQEDSTLVSVSLNLSA